MVVTCKFYGVYEHAVLQCDGIMVNHWSESVIIKYCIDPQILKYAALPAAVVGLGSVRIYSMNEKKNDELISPREVRKVYTIIISSMLISPVWTATFTKMDEQKCKVLLLKCS